MASLALSLRLLAFAGGSTALVSLLLGACASTEKASCAVGSDCVSGICQSNGTCKPIATKDAEQGDASMEDADTVSDQDGGTDATSAPDGQVGDASGCSNLDRDITTNEVTLAAGLSANFAFASNVTFDTGGKKNADGTRTWELDKPFAGEKKVRVETKSLIGSWFDKDFSGATYTTRLTQSSDLLGVFERTSGELLLRGIASPESSFNATKVTYAKPVGVLQFPLKPGKNWSAESQVTGTYLGVFTTYSEKYENAVDAEGTLKTAFGTFRVLRVSTVLTKTVGITRTVTRSQSYLSECYGVVANISAETSETNADFSKVSELSRLVP
jgi:hypothetical protein